MKDVQAHDLIGKWERVPGEDCTRIYPSRLEFLNETVYLGIADDKNSYTEWGGGSYEFADNNTIRIQIQTDEMQPYHASFEGGILTFKDKEGCRVSYRRTGGGS
ncbi:MAG: hypothetical protein PVF65_11550 [Sphingomonadales bacterium]|jgi:hypothetical protein